MRCPGCLQFPTSVKQTTRPLDESLEHGDVKRRLRKCRNCDKNFTTFEIHESLFRTVVPKQHSPLSREPLLVESEETAKKPKRSKLIEVVKNKPIKKKKVDDAQ